jgi:hypothetical protein
LALETQVRGYWTDPSTGLIWTAKDNGKDVSWNSATKYCRNLRIAGYSDWRLPNLTELQGIYDENAFAPGLGVHEIEPTTWLGQASHRINRLTKSSSLRPWNPA